MSMGLVNGNLANQNKLKVKNWVNISQLGQKKYEKEMYYIKYY